jgi:uncharacterized protein with HEPN domain
MEDRDSQILSKIMAESVLIADMLTGFDLDMFSQDEKTKRAVCMTLINIGELVKALSEDFRADYKHIPWRAIAGLRDVTAHRYQTLRMEDIWATVQQDILILREELTKIV